MVYNIGSHDLPLGEIGTKVNDNTYHIVRFQRFGGNATLQLDDYNVQTVHPQGIVYDLNKCSITVIARVEHRTFTNTTNHKRVNANL